MCLVIRTAEPDAAQTTLCVNRGSVTAERLLAESLLEHPVGTLCCGICCGGGVSRLRRRGLRLLCRPCGLGSCRSDVGLQLGHVAFQLIDVLAQVIDVTLRRTGTERQSAGEQGGGKPAVLVPDGEAESASVPATAMIGRALPWVIFILSSAMNS